MLNTAPALPERSLRTLKWVGGHPVLDFVNTVDVLGSPEARGYLHDYGDLLSWAQQADLIGPVSRRALSAGSPAAQAAAFREYRALQSDLAELFQAVVEHEALPQAALDHLNSLVQKTAPWRRVTACDDGGRKVSCGWDFSGAPPVAVLGPVVWKAVELLESGPLDRIKACPSDDCRWLFLDSSKNRSRQWCSMETCGNASKVRRFRSRQKH